VIVECRLQIVDLLLVAREEQELAGGNPEKSVGKSRRTRLF